MSGDNGGPAFPAQAWGPDQKGFDGATLRDYFAAKAMQELLSWEELRAAHEVARHAYQQADAMLKERAK